MNPLRALRRRRAPEIPKSLCLDCGIDLQPDVLDEEQVFMVRGDVWAEAGLRLGCICVDCLEQRLGRPLNVNDLGSEGVLNEPSEYDTPRLRALKEQAALARAWRAYEDDDERYDDYFPGVRESEQERYERAREEA